MMIFKKRIVDFIIRNLELVCLLIETYVQMYKIFKCDVGKLLVCGILGRWDC
jgi:hypothetical protein